MKVKKYMDGELFLSTKKISERLNVNQRTVIRWIKSGKLKAKSDGNRYFVDVEEYRRFLCENFLGKKR